MLNKKQSKPPKTFDPLEESLKRFIDLRNCVRLKLDYESIRNWLEYQCSSALLVDIDAPILHYRKKIPKAYLRGMPKSLHC